MRMISITVDTGRRSIEIETSGGSSSTLKYKGCVYGDYKKFRKVDGVITIPRSTEGLSYVDRVIVFMDRASMENAVREIKDVAKILKLGYRELWK